MPGVRPSLKMRPRTRDPRPTARPSVGPLPSSTNHPKKSGELVNRRLRACVRLGVRCPIMDAKSLSPSLSPSLIEATVSDVREVICRLESERADIDTRLDELRLRCRQWEKILPKVGQNWQPRTRAKKGENDRTIAQIYEEHPDRGYTLPALAETTGISWSSVRNVVSKNGIGKYEERDGKWYRKEKSP